MATKSPDSVYQAIVAGMMATLRSPKAYWLPMEFTVRIPPRAFKRLVDTTVIATTQEKHPPDTRRLLLAIDGYRVTVKAEDDKLDELVGAIEDAVNKH